MSRLNNIVIIPPTFYNHNGTGVVASQKNLHWMNQLRQSMTGTGTIRKINPNHRPERVKSAIRSH